MLTRPNNDRIPNLLAGCVAALLILTVCTVHFLPRTFGVILVSWAMLSLSVGIAVGHCVLSEPER
jgi:hypothetical protein